MTHLPVIAEDYTSTTCHRIFQIGGNHSEAHPTNGTTLPSRDVMCSRDVQSPCRSKKMNAIESEKAADPVPPAESDDPASVRRLKGNSPESVQFPDDNLDPPLSPLPELLSGEEEIANQKKQRSAMKSSGDQDSTPLGKLRNLLMPLSDTVAQVFLVCLSLLLSWDRSSAPICKVPATPVYFTWTWGRYMEML